MGAGGEETRSALVGNWNLIRWSSIRHPSHGVILTSLFRPATTTPKHSETWILEIVQTPNKRRFKGGNSSRSLFAQLQANFLQELCIILRSECGGTRWRTGGEVKGKLANGVGSQYSHTASGRSVSSITNADAHNSAASSRLNRLPRRFKWTRPFRRKTKSGFCACAIRFHTSSTTWSLFLISTLNVSRFILSAASTLYSKDVTAGWCSAWRQVDRGQVINHAVTFVTPSSNVSGQYVEGKRWPVPVKTYSFPLRLFTCSFTRSFDSERILMLDAAFV